MRDLEQEALAADQRKVWQLANRLAPWKPQARAHLRGEDGQILSPSEQLAHLIQHSRTKFGNSTDYAPAHRLTQDLNLTADALAHAIGKLPIRKAAPSTSAPSAAWRLCSCSGWLAPSGLVRRRTCRRPGPTQGRRALLAAEARQRQQPA
jgi:hypothetical protein